MKNNSLNVRMKENYENRSQTHLLRRTPVIIRIDGKSFHNFTKHLKKPFDEILKESMQHTMFHLCKNIQGCVFGYTQSDEITLVLKDYETLTTDAWFDYNVQKICSISASMATLYFHDAFNENASKYFSKHGVDDEYYNSVYDCIVKGALFDSRCFNVPEDEVCNCLIWRQKDATRNAIQMLGQTYFTHKQLQGKSGNEIQDMLMTEKGINFNDMPVSFKRGSCCIKEEDTGWVLDENIPVFTQDRNYIERFLKRKE